MSAQAALEEQAYAAMLDINKHRLRAHTAGERQDRTAMWSAFQDVQSAARAGITALEGIEKILNAKEAATCKAPQNDCHYFPAPDDQCRVPAMLHTEFCAKHQDQAANDWYEAHEATDCCKVHCEGADHLIDGELIEEATG